MSDDNPFSMVREIVGVIKLGGGLLGKSAMVLGILELGIIVAVFRLHSDTMILGALGLGALFFFAWFAPIIRFAHRHPAEVLLEGSQWAEHQRVQLAAAKDYTPQPEDLARQQFAPGSERPDRQIGATPEEKS